MSRMILAGVAAAMSLSASLAMASPRDEAQALLTAALAETKAKGVDGAAKEISNGGAWVKGSTYVFVADLKANILAHAVNPKMIGKNLWEVKDAAGKLFVQEQVKIVQESGKGSVQMRWMNPSTKQIGDAEALVARIPGSEAYLGAVYFK